MKEQLTQIENNFIPFNVDKAWDIQIKRDQFFETNIPESIQMINEFLDFLEVDKTHTIFAGRNGYEPKNNRYHNEAKVTRLLPPKYTNRYFSNEKDFSFSFIQGIKSKFSNTQGITHLNLFSGNRINVREGQDLLPILNHENYCDIFRGGSLCRSKYLGETQNLDQQGIGEVFIEGAVEFMNQLTLDFYGKHFEYKAYNRYTNFIKYLVEQIARMNAKNGLPDYKIAIRCLVEFGSTGGIENEFYKQCNAIHKNNDFFTGFDLYNKDSTKKDKLQIAELKYYLINHSMEPNLQQIVESLRNS
jgi:hypothetical protein